MHNVISPDAGWEAAVSTAVMGEGGARACEPRRRGNGACDADAARRARARVRGENPAPNKKPNPAAATLSSFANVVVLDTRSL